MIIKAQFSDYPEITHMLEVCDFPFSDVQDKDIEFWIIRENGILIATGALQHAGDSAIFRSFSVNPEFRNKGFGERIYESILKSASVRGISTLYLLTTTAERYFLKRGWTRLDRNSTPKAVLESSEFKTICPSTAVCMAFPLQPKSR